MAAAVPQTTTLSFDAILAQSHHRHHLHLLSTSSSSSSSSSTSHSRHFLSPFPHPYPFLSLSTPTTNNHQPQSLPPTSNPSFPTTTPPVSFLDPDGAQKLRLIEEYRYRHEFDDGSSLEVRLMAPEEVDATVQLLAKSFSEAMGMREWYVSLLAFLVKQYVLEKRSVLPHAATVVGFYKKGGGGDDEEEEEEGEEELAGTAEISFDALGTNASPPTPPPPRDCPYICNMTVKKELRRKRIGRHLLDACEQLISLMSEKEEVYLHCRVIDRIPHNMYKKAGYCIVKKDNILVWFAFQRRKNLMRKKLLPRATTEFEDKTLQ